MRNWFVIHVAGSSIYSKTRRTKILIQFLSHQSCRKSGKGLDKNFFKLRKRPGSFVLAQGKLTISKTGRETQPRSRGKQWTAKADESENHGYRMIYLCNNSLRYTPTIYQCSVSFPKQMLKKKSVFNRDILSSISLELRGHWLKQPFEVIIIFLLGWPG